MNVHILILFVAVLVTQPISSSKILGYLVGAGRSHFIIHDSLLRGLAAKGHDVTVVGILPAPKETIPNYRYIELGLNDEENALIESSKKGLLQNAETKENPIWTIPKFLSGFTRLMVKMLTHPSLEKLKQEEHFDLVVFGYFINDYQFGIAAHFKAPAVIISGTGAIYPLRKLLGNPSGLAYTPLPLFIEKGDMSFLKRVIQFLIAIAEKTVFDMVDYFVYEPYYSQIFPSDRYPSFAETKKNISLVMVSSHFSQSGPMAMFPGLLEVSGIQIKKNPSRLPVDVKEWLDGAKDGVIFFSFGSNIHASAMTNKKRISILNVIGKLKQRVLWKWEDDLPDKPKNLMIGKWLPQDDILAHRNVILFISHCGKGSVNEAKYHGVPILAIPMFGDQPSNADAIVKEGWAVQVNYASLNEKTLSTALNEMLTNPTYRNVVKPAADLYKDRPSHPLDIAIYWVEYVIRHNSAKHMQSQAVHLNWFQNHSLDVISLIVVAMWIGWKLFKLSLRFVYRKLVGSKNKTKRD